VCNSDTCQFTDESRAIGPNGANLTGGGTGGNAAASTSRDPYVPFNGDLPALLPQGWMVSLVVATVGVVIGGWSVLGGRM
jgi:hypothetical protein